MHCADRFTYPGMLNSGLRACSFALAIASLLPGAACGEGRIRTGPVTFDIRTGGDDGLTQRFADALDATFRGSGLFVLGSDGRPIDLVVTVPASLKWRRIGRRERVTYVAEFSGRGNQTLGESKGSCWDSDLPRCASQVLRDANVVLSRTDRAPEKKGSL